MMKNKTMMSQLKIKMNLIITLDGLTREYIVNPDQIINNNWNEVLEDMLDTLENVKD